MSYNEDATIAILYTAMKPRTICQRLLASRPVFKLTDTRAASPSLLAIRSRPFSISSSRTADEQPSTTTVAFGAPDTLQQPAPRTKDGGLGVLSELFKVNDESRSADKARRSSFFDVGNVSSIGRNDRNDLSMGAYSRNEAEQEPHHFHVYATRHNCHITITRPNREKMMSVSCGNIGFRHAGRKHYDSAFQLAGFVLGRIRDNGWHSEIHRIEVILRGFGAGREAVTKALLGLEGRLLRDKIVKVTDATRLKFGGTRSKKPRRLG